MGKRVKQLAGDDLTEEEIIQALSYAKAQKKAKKHIYEETENPTISDNSSDEKDYSDIDRKPRERKNSHNSTNLGDESNDSSDIKKYNEDDDLIWIHRSIVRNSGRPNFQICLSTIIINLL